MAGSLRIMNHRILEIPINGPIDAADSAMTWCIADREAVTIVFMDTSLLVLIVVCVEVAIARSGVIGLGEMQVDLVVFLNR